MTIKEFSEKHGIVFFWATIVLVVLNLIMSLGAMRLDHRNGGKGMMKDGYGRYEKMKMDKKGGDPMMNMQKPEVPQDAAGTLPEGTGAVPEANQ